MRIDINLDGPPRTVNSTDTSTVSADFGQTMRRGVLSRPAVATAGVGNSRGYAGYAFDDAAVVHHVRHRVSSPTDGRWLRRDPIGYVDGASLYEYVAGRAIRARDPMGMQDTPVACVPHAKLNSEGMVKMGSGCGGFKEIIGGIGPDDRCARHHDPTYPRDCVYPHDPNAPLCGVEPGGVFELYDRCESFAECLSKTWSTITPQCRERMKELVIGLCVWGEDREETLTRAYEDMGHCMAGFGGCFSACLHENFSMQCAEGCGTGLLDSILKQIDKKTPWSILTCALECTGHDNFGGCMFRCLAGGITPPGSGCLTCLAGITGACYYQCAL